MGDEGCTISVPNKASGARADEAKRVKADVEGQQCDVELAVGGGVGVGERGGKVGGGAR